MAAAVAETLPVRRDVVVLGHSLGGVIALELASGRYGIQVDRMNTDEELRALHDQVVTLPGLGHNAHVEDPAATSALSTR